MNRADHSTVSGPHFQISINQLKLFPTILLAGNPRLTIPRPVSLPNLIGTRLNRLRHIGVRKAENVTLV
ncbi:hypothetical protein SDC9_190917 [bioreactor metagenome]|uniref:Uncharacterized protein n=1 Tax=bioreactor metagenome TaxID=1076179 RepID=A0A645HWG4_9ZZZZ